jgi:hypothetical protein
MSLEDHLAHPEIGIVAHVAARRAALAESLRPRVPIYLDTRFWVMAREVLDGTSRRAEERAIVERLRRLVDGGLAFCPISEPAFSELMKQGDPARRARTARVMEELGCRVAIDNDVDRMVAEAESLLVSRLGTGQSAALPAAWTSASFVLGEVYPVETAFSLDQELAIQKETFDRIWDTPLAEIALSMGSALYTGAEELDAEARRLTEENSRHRTGLRSFDKLLEQEFHGTALTIVEHAPRLPALLAPFAGSMPITPSAVFTNAIREMLKNPEHARLMPTAHVHAVIHALFRWEYRDKPISANDLVDFRHAAAALSRCSLMLVEGELGRTLRHKRFPLAEFHGCRVVSDRAEAVRELDRLLE